MKYEEKGKINTKEYNNSYEKIIIHYYPKAGVKKNKHFVDDALEIFEKAGI